MSRVEKLLFAEPAYFSASDMNYFQFLAKLSWRPICIVFRLSGQGNLRDNLSLMLTF